MGVAPEVGDNSPNSREGCVTSLLIYLNVSDWNL